MYDQVGTATASMLHHALTGMLVAVVAAYGVRFAAAWYRAGRL